jgi:hypothetical protein
MTRSRRPLPALTLAPLAALALAALALAGCGSVAAGSGSASQPGATSPASAPAAGGAGQPDGATASPRATRLAAGLVLCNAPASATQVVITRLTTGGPILPAGPGVAAAMGHLEPRGLSSAAEGPVVKGAAQAHELARALCGLPQLPAGTLNCPDLRPGGYRLMFTAVGRILPEITVQTSGCESVTGAGTIRTASSRPAFLQLLAGLAGPLPQPGPIHEPGTPVTSGPFRPLAAA